MLFEQSFYDNLILLRLLLAVEKIYQTLEVRSSRSMKTVRQKYFALDCIFMIPLRSNCLLGVYLKMR